MIVIKTYISNLVHINNAYLTGQTLNGLLVTPFNLRIPWKRYAFCQYPDGSKGGIFTILKLHNIKFVEGGQ